MLAVRFWLANPLVIVSFVVTGKGRSGHWWYGRGFLLVRFNVTISLAVVVVAIVVAVASPIFSPLSIHLSVQDQIFVLKKKKEKGPISFDSLSFILKTYVQYGIRRGSMVTEVPCLSN